MPATKYRKVGNIIIPAGAKIRKTSAHYDFSNQRNSNGGRKRRQARIETKGEEGVMSPFHRLQGVSLSRDMVRNNPQAHGMAKTLRSNVIGSYGKLRFTKTGDWFSKAQKYFNSVWAKSADFIDGSSFRECLQLAVYALSHEGDFVCVFDDGIISGIPNGTGKLVFFEADQICNLKNSDFTPFKEKGFSQDSGIIFDKYGRKCGVIVSKSRGTTETELNNAFVLIADPDGGDSNFKHVMRKYRLRQGRGVADAIPALPTTIDGREILDYELQTGKMASARYCSIIDPDGGGGDHTPKGFAEFDDDIGTDLTEEEASGKIQDIDDDEYEIDSLTEYTGGNVDKLPFGSQINFDTTTRPNANLPAFLDYTTDLSGFSHGVNHAYARGKADTSYTAFRGDMVMTWMTFTDFQQFLEDNFSDWIGRMVLNRAIRLELIPVAPKGWAQLIAWQYPVMPAVDGQKEQTALTQKLRNCQTTLAATIGPHWKEQINQLADEQAYVREKKVSFAALETVAGAPTTETKKEE